MSVAIDVSLLERLEQEAVSRRAYDEASAISSTIDELRSMRAAQHELTERMNSHAAVRDYAAASAVQEELQQLEQGIGRLTNTIQAQYGELIAALPPQHAVPMGKPASSAPPMVMGRPMVNPVANPAIVIHPQPTAVREPLLAGNARDLQPIIVNGRSAPPGGIWSEESYTGLSTFCVGFLCTPLIMACPLDTRRVYIAPGGHRFPEVGNGYRNALVFLWLLSLILFVVLIAIRASNGTTQEYCSCCEYSSYYGDYRCGCGNSDIQCTPVG